MSRHREAADRIIADSHPDEASLRVDADIVANWVIYADACIAEVHDLARRVRQLEAEKENQP